MKFLISISILFLFLNCSSSTRFLGPDVSTDILAVKNKLSDKDCTGEDCSSHTETFYLQGMTAIIKMLIVLDVSSSMDLKKLANSAMSILNVLEPFDVQLAITTADHGDHEKRNGKVGEQKWQNYDGDRPYFGKFMRLEYRGELLDDTILTKQIPNYRTVFYDTLALNPGQKGCNGELPPYCQGGHEQPLRSAKSALEREENQDFFGGEGEIVFILVLTNEDERVEDPENATTGQDVKDTFESLYPDNNLYGFGMIVQDKSCYKNQRKANSRSEYSHRVAELAKVTLGRNINICENEFGPALAGISRLMKKSVFDNVQLQQHPKEVTQISIEPLQNVDWKVKGRHILFSPALQPDSKLTVYYTSS